MMALYPLLRPLAFALDAETAHRATIAALKLLPTRKPPAFPPRCDRPWRDSTFPRRSGWPPGSTRMPKCPRQMLGLGFGFVEVGTVTPRPQPGNPEAAAVPARARTGR